MRQLFYFLTILFLCFSTSYSQNIEMESNTESWYTYWGIGSGSVGYPAELQIVIDYLNDQDGVTNTSIALDMLGFYWHLSPKTIGGVIINGVGDRFEVNGESMQINQYTYGGSFMHYPGKSFGSGLFVRADIGLAKLVIQESGGSSTSSESGFGILVGGGWSFDFGGTRLLLNVNYAYRGIESEAYNTLSFSLGGLF